MSSSNNGLGNKPLVVIISLIASIIAIIAFLSGKQSIQEFSSPSSSVSSNPVVVTVFVPQSPNGSSDEVQPVVIITATNKPPTQVTSNQNSSNSYARISDEVEEVNLRRSPGYLNKNDDNDVIVKIPKGALVEIVGGPTDKDNLTWWKVSWNGHEGWIADHTGNGRTIMIFNP